MNEIIVTNVVSIVATLLGTILGWLLNEFSKSGKTKLFVSEWNEKFLSEKMENLSDYYGGEELPKDNYYDSLHLRKDKAIDKNDANHYEYSFLLDVYNSSGNTKIMRNLHIIFYDKHKWSKKNLFEDNKVKIQIDREGNSETVEVINLSPKNIIRLYLNNDIEVNDLLYDTTNIYLEYLNEKNKKKKIKVKTVDYRHYFNI